MQNAIAIQDRSGLILHEDDAKETAKSVRLYLRSFLELASYYHAKQRLLFKVRHKFHYMVHACSEIEAYRLNQRLWANWGEESFLGKMKSIAVRCHGKTMTSRIFQRYLLVFAISLQEHRRVAKDL